LDREVSLYKHITDALVINGRSPNFIPYLDHALCTDEDLGAYSDVVNTLRAVTYNRALEYVNDENKKKELIPLLRQAKISTLVTETPCAPADYVRGGCLDYFDWTRFFLLDPEQVYSVFFSLVYALDALHAVGVVHRDLHPGNILVRRYPIDDNYAVIYVHPTDNKKYYVLRGKDLTARPFIFDWDNAIMSSDVVALKPAIRNDRITLLENTVIQTHKDTTDPGIRRLSENLRSVLYIVRADPTGMFGILETHGFFERFKPNESTRQFLSRLSPAQVDIFGPNDTARMAASVWHDELRRASRKRKHVEEDDETESDIEPL